MPQAVYPHSASSHPLPGNTSTAVTLRGVVLGKRPARVLNVGLGLMGREGQARRSLERGKKSESPGQPTLQACEYLRALPEPGTRVQGGRRH